MSRRKINCGYFIRFKHLGYVKQIKSASVRSIFHKVILSTLPQWDHGKLSGGRKELSLCHENEKPGSLLVRFNQTAATCFLSRKSSNSKPIILT